MHEESCFDKLVSTIVRESDIYLARSSHLRLVPGIIPGTRLEHAASSHGQQHIVSKYL